MRRDDAKQHDKIRETQRKAQEQQENRPAVSEHHEMPEDMQRDVMKHGAPPLDEAGKPMPRQSVKEEMLGTDKQSEAPGMDEYDSHEKHQTGTPLKRPA